MHTEQQVKPLEGMVQKAERLEKQVKEFNEAKKARKLYEEEARKMEEQRDKALADKKGDRARLQELELECQQMRSDNKKLEADLTLAKEEAGKDGIESFGLVFGAVARVFALVNRYLTQHILARSTRRARRLD